MGTPHWCQDGTLTDTTILDQSGPESKTNEDTGFHTVPKGISPKVKVVMWLEFELAYKAVFQHVNNFPITCNYGEYSS